MNVSKTSFECVIDVLSFVRYGCLKDVLGTSFVYWEWLLQIYSYVAVSFVRWQYILTKLNNFGLKNISSSYPLTTWLIIKTGVLCCSDVLNAWVAGCCFFMKKFYILMLKEKVSTRWKGFNVKSKNQFFFNLPKENL